MMRFLAFYKRGERASAQAAGKSMLQPFRDGARYFCAENADFIPPNLFH